MLAAEKHDEFLRVRINLPSFQLDLSTKEPAKSMTELRRIVEALDVEDDLMYEEFVTHELRSFFSETFMSNAQLLTAVKKLLKQENDYRASTVEIPAEAIVDLEHNTREVRLAPKDVQRAIVQFVQRINPPEIKQGIIHIIGSLDRDSRLLIADHIHRQMPTAQLRAFHSESPDGNILVEGIFFGDFDEDDEE